MVIWRLADPQDYRFAAAGTRGTWEQVEPPRSSADTGAFRRASPLVMEWEDGSDPIGDFTWVGIADIAVRQDVFVQLDQRLHGLTGGDRDGSGSSVAEAKAGDRSREASGLVAVSRRRSAFYA